MKVDFEGVDFLEALLISGVPFHHSYEYVPDFFPVLEDQVRVVVLEHNVVLLKPPQIKNQNG